MEIKKVRITDEVAELKRGNTEKIEEIIRLKTKIHKFTTNIILVSLVVFGASVLYVKLSEDSFNKEVTKNSITMTELKEVKESLSSLNKQHNEMVNSSSLVYVPKEDLLNDMIKNYPEISIKTKILILETILSESEKYNMNPLILYSLVYVESSFRVYLEHEPTMIDKSGKKIKIRAVGLTGVVWEWWGDKLKDAGIAETRGDLFDPVTNIKAGAFVYNELYHMEKHKSANYKDESALLRYFGGDFVSYIGRIDAKIATFVRPNLYRKN